MKSKRFSAFTLNEMLLVLAIISVLLMLSFPSLMGFLTKAKAQEAKIQLKHLSTLQTQYRYTNSVYSMDINVIDFEPPLTVTQGGTANYRYEIIEASATTFKARAEAVVDFDGDGIFNVWEIDEKGVSIEKVKD
tara:strand:+ start:413538 stop:413939 length:402 start_codon:yes stop_codon:yes gene_type:complete